jgi:signal transduction histidine kinase
LFIFFPTENAAFHTSQIPNIIISTHVGLLIGFIWERHKRINFLQQTQLNNILNIFSHDMVSPMNSLLSLLSLNDRNLLNKVELDTHIESIKKTTTNNVLLLQNLVKWSKSQLDGFKPNAEPVEIKALVDDAINLLQPAAVEKNITISNEALESYKCLADLEMTKLILRNTLSNAIKFSHPNGTVIVSSKRNNEFITLSVKDAGVGMAHEEVDRLFTMTVQSMPGTANERGTGIGLYITREFVSLNKGQIKVESKKGSGSTVTISLPGTF